MAAKWFDFKDYDAKLERISTAPGHYILRLEMPTARLPEPEGGTLVGDMLMDMGWTVEAGDDKRVVLENHQPLNTAMQIVTAIRSFFSEAEVAAAHKPLPQLRQGERAEGIEAPKIISLKELEGSIHGVEKNNFDRIRASVSKAIANMAEREKRADNVLFAGKGMAVGDHLTDRIAQQKGWMDLEASYLAYRTIAEAAAMPNSGMATRLTQLGRALAASDETEIKSAETWIMDAIFENAEGLGDQQEKLRQERLFQAISLRLGEDSLIRPRDFVAGMVMKNSSHMSAAMMTGIAVGPDDSFEAAAAKVPFRVLRDNSVPTRTLVQNMKAVAKAIRYIASEMEMEPNALFPGQENVPARFSFDAVSADKGAEGRVASFQQKADGQEGENDATRPLVLSLSVKRGGTFIHELGHLVDQGNKLSDEERHDILRSSGVLMRVREELERIFPNGGEQYDYFAMEEEIFARTFDAHFVNLARSRGDKLLETIGGRQVTYGADLAAPFGDLETSSRFMDMLKSTLEAKKEAKHSATIKPASPMAEIHGSIAP